jgi:hypothetical protein
MTSVCVCRSPWSRTKACRSWRPLDNAHKRTQTVTELVAAGHPPRRLAWVGGLGRLFVLIVAPLPHTQSVSYIPSTTPWYKQISYTIRGRNLVQLRDQLQLHCHRVYIYIKRLISTVFVVCTWSWICRLLERFANEIHTSDILAWFNLILGGTMWYVLLKATCFFRS